MENNKGDHYAKLAIRISYLNIMLAVASLLNGGISALSLIVCLIAFSYIRKAEKHNTTEIKKVKKAKTISNIIAVVSVIIVALHFISTLF